MLKTFIERPVLSTVVSVIIVILGILGIYSLPITTYPEIAPPTIQISANYPGANAQTVLESVVIPIEEQVNGVEGMDYITSTATNNGTATITVFFKQNVNPDIAAVNVQNRVARATPLLPAEVTRFGVVTQKRQTSSLMFLTFYSDKYDQTYIHNYVDINVAPQIKRVEGVGDAGAFGMKEYSMRVWLDPVKMANYGLVPTDILGAINEQSLEAAAGQLGENNGESFQYVLRYSGKYRTEDQYNNVIIKSLDNGNILYLKDVATIEMGTQSYSGVSRYNGKYAAAMGIYQTPGTNARQIINDVKDKLKEIEGTMPEGLEYKIMFDGNEFLDSSISKVVATLIEAFILVFLVVFIFLQDFRSTLIPLIAVPVSIIGTFFFLNIFGFTINILTLFALVLAIGIVVDDAIVVVEAVHAKMEKTNLDGKKASIDTMHEISGAIISITLVMAAVFVPVTFIKGPTGVFYQQFGITILVAILISAVNALTLSPALCALFLKPHQDEHGRKKSFLQRFYDAFNRVFNAMTARYAKSFGFFLKHKWVTFVILTACGLLAIQAAKTTPTGFVPNEDRGFIMANFELPQGASADRVVEYQRKFKDAALQIPEVETVAMISGFSFVSGQGSNYGMGMIRLKDLSERKDKSESTDAVVGKLFGLSMMMPESRSIFFSPPSIPGFGVSAGFDVMLLDKSGGDLTQFNQVANEYVMQLMQRPEIQYANTSFNSSYAQYELELNVPKAKQAGVPVSSIFSTLQGYIGGIYAADFTRYGKQYKVMIQALPEDRAKEGDLSKIYVRTSSGEMAPITQFINLKRVYGPQAVDRFNLFTSANIQGAPALGYSTGDAINAVQEVSQQLNANYGIDFTGITREEINSGSQTVLIFLLSLIFIYFILSAQYESYILPLSVILSLPGGVMGAYWAQKLAGLENNIYFQISLIMLIGLLAKNAILIVEFALQARKRGMSISASAISGARSRLRPILMTSLAFIVGLMPLVLATGTGYVGNRSIATGAAFGLLIGTIVGVFNIPVLYTVFQWLQEKLNPSKWKKETI